MVGRAVRGTGQLTERILGGNPCFNIELASSTGTQISCSDINDTVCQSQRLQHAFLPGDETVVLCLCFFRSCVDKHFQLVELVHTNDAAGVLAAGSGFAAVASGPTGITQWSIGEVDDFVRVITGERNLAGSSEIEVICGEVVNLI